MNNDPYRIKFENGKISIALFQKGNPIPHTSFKGAIDSKETQNFLVEVKDKISDEKAQEFISSFIFFGNNYSKRIKEDFEKKNGKLSKRKI